MNFFPKKYYQVWKKGSFSVSALFQHTIPLSLLVDTKNKKHHKKKYKSKRLKQKRLKEQVYLAHFLAVASLYPTRIISGLDDGKEPDFTIVLDGKVIGVELTTLPRLRERMPSEHLQWRFRYWSLQRSPFFKKNVRKSVSASQDKLFTREKNYDLHRLNHPYQRQHFHYRHSHCHYMSYSCSYHAYLFLPYSYLYNHVFYKSSFYYTSNKNISFALLQIFKKIKQKASSFLQNTAKKVASLQSSFINLKQKKTKVTFQNRVNQTHFLHLLSTKIDLIIQSDIDAVMKKKAHKVQAYQERRQLDEIWLLIHSNEVQPTGVLSLPHEYSEEILTHCSDYDAVWLTVFPKRAVYQVKN